MTLNSKITREHDDTFTLVITWPNIKRVWSEFDSWSEAMDKLEKIERGENFDLVTGERIVKAQVQ